MSKNSTWALVLVFLILLAVLLWLPRVQDKLVKPTATPTAFSQPLFSFQAGDVTFVKIVSSNGQAIDLQRDSSNLWLMPGSSGEVDSAAVEAAVNSATASTVLSTLQASSNLAQFGLAYPPAYSVTFTLQDGAQHTLVLGDVTPTGHGYYVRLADDTIVVVSQYSLDILLDFIQNPPLTTPTPSSP